MRVFLLGAALCAMATSALAGPADYYQPQASLYMSFAFDKPPVKLNAPPQAALRYGVQLDQDWRNHFNDDNAPILRWEFSDLKFDNLSIAGTPLLNREMILRADEEGGALDYVKDNFALIALGVGGAILAFAIVDGDKDSRNRDVSDPDGIGTVGSGNIDNQSPADADGLPGSNESPNSGGMDSGAGGGTPEVPDVGGILDGVTGGG